MRRYRLPSNNKRFRHLADATVQVSPVEQATVTLNVDYGAEQVVTDPITLGSKRMSWYGLMLSGRYALNEKFAAAVRGEYYVDAQGYTFAGFRVAPGEDGSFPSYTFRTGTLTLEANPTSNLQIPDAGYDAGVSLERCGLLEDASAAYAAVLARRPDAYRARLRRALCNFARHGDSSLDETILELARAAGDAGDREPGVLVALGWTYLYRARAQASAEDMARAGDTIERALLIDENHPPGAPPADRLAAGSGPAAQRAPPGETGERRHARAAASRPGRPPRACLRPGVEPRPGGRRGSRHLRRGAGRAGRLRPGVGAVRPRTQTRAQAVVGAPELCRSQAGSPGLRRSRGRVPPGLSVAPESFVARLGLATALRHMPGAGPAALVEAESLLAARPGEPGRPEAVFNRALIAADGVGSSPDPYGAMMTAPRLLTEFIERASADPAYAPAVRTAQDELEDIRAVACLIIEDPERR